jgi:hypothetical protein
LLKLAIKWLFCVCVFLRSFNTLGDCTASFTWFSWNRSFHTFRSELWNWIIRCHSNWLTIILWKFVTITDWFCRLRRVLLLSCKGYFCRGFSYYLLWRIIFILDDLWVSCFYKSLFWILIFSDSICAWFFALDFISWSVQSVNLILHGFTNLALDNLIKVFLDSGRKVVGKSRLTWPLSKVSANWRWRYILLLNSDIGVRGISLDGAWSDLVFLFS